MIEDVQAAEKAGSRLIQPRGLKLQTGRSGGYCETVEAYTASWIEMVNSIKDAAAQNGRGLYSLVD